MHTLAPSARPSVRRLSTPSLPRRPSPRTKSPAAALAGLGSAPVNFWRLNDLDRIPDESRQRARDRVEAQDLELLDIGALTLAELAALDG